MQITFVDKPEQLEPWPYKWRPPNIEHVREIQMNWDDASTRALLKVQLTGLGVFYVQRLEHQGFINGEPTFIFRIAYTFDLRDPILQEPSIFIKQPMLLFRRAFMATRETLLHDDSGYTKPRPDLGHNYVEAIPYLVWVAADEACNLIRETHDVYSMVNIRRLVEDEGYDFELLYKFPDFEAR
jgi:hypothetical protein